MRVACLVDDLAFDSRLPGELRLQSPMHFTPVDVGRHVAGLVAPDGGEIVLDVGAGAGKFCLVAAYARRAASFVGVELRAHLVTLASRLAEDWRLPNVAFVQGDAFTLDWSEFDGFYFFNPFAEQVLQGGFMLDETIDVDRANHDRYLEATLDRLTRARPDTRVVTYHGLGADLPNGYELVSADLVGSDRVELWIKTGARTTRQFLHVEVPE